MNISILTTVSKCTGFVFGVAIVSLASLAGSSSSNAETFVLNGDKALNTNPNFRTIDGHPRMSIWKHSLNDADQNFDRKNGGNGGEHLVHRRTAKCVNAPRRWNGAEVNVYPCRIGDGDQNFNIESIGNGDVQIRVANTTFCLDNPNRIDGGLVTLQKCVGNVNQRFKINGGTTPPPPSTGYYRNLSSLSNDAWDQYSGDNTRFDPMWAGEVDERSKTPSEIAQIYTDLTTTIFGQRRRMTAGYLYDVSYFNGQGKKWHAALDIDAPKGTSVKAVIGGTTWNIQNTTGNFFMAVKGDDGKLWIYGHLGSLSVTNGKRIEAGNEVGKTGSLNHLHLEVQNNASKYEQTSGAHPNQQFVRDVTFSPLQAFWQVKNR